MEVKERIIVESGKLFGKYGLRSMTMDALAGEMGISKRTIYEKFKDRDTLLKEVISYYSEQSNKQAHKIIDESANAIEAMFRITKLTIDQIRQTNPVFFHDFRKYHKNVFNEFHSPGKFSDLSITRKLLETGIRQGVFRKDIHIGIVNQTLHTLFDQFGPESQIVEAGYSRKDIFHHMIIPYFRGISTRKGEQLLEDCKTMLD